LPAEFPEGQVKYVALDRVRMVASFSPQISLPLGPFQGTFGVAPPRDREVVGTYAPGVYSSVTPGQPRSPARASRRIKNLFDRHDYKPAI
jgi:acetamidase/formamidase